MDRIRRSLTWMGLLLVLVLPLTLPATGWARARSVLVYMCGDNDLSEDAEADFTTLRGLGATKDLALVVQCDTDSSDPARRWVATETEGRLTEIGEPDTAKSQTLIDFLQWAREAAPADSYLLVIWGHGYGWKGLLRDYTSMDDLSLPQFAHALRRGMGQERDRLDAVVFDACEMAGLETAYEIRDLARYAVFSQMPIPDRGLPYEDWLGWLMEHPEAQTERLLRRLVLGYVRLHSGKAGDAFEAGVAMSAVRLHRIDELMDGLGRLVEALQASYSLPMDFYEAQVPGKTGFNRWDLLNLLDSLPDYAYDPAVDEAVGRIRRLLGHPGGGAEAVPSELCLIHDRPGRVSWTVDDWANSAEEPLSGPDPDGLYRVRIAPFQPGVLETRYRFLHDDGSTTEEHGQIRNRDYAYSSRFPADGPIVAEGHTREGMRGFSIAVLDPFSYNDNHFLYHQMRPFGELAFADTAYGRYLYSRYESFWTWMRWDEIRADTARVQLTWRRGHPILLYRDLSGRFTATQSVTPRVIGRGQSLLLAFHCPKNGRLLPLTNCPLSVDLAPGEGGALELRFSERRGGRPLPGLTCPASALEGTPPAHLSDSALALLRPFVTRRGQFLKLHPTQPEGLQ